MTYAGAKIFNEFKELHPNLIRRGITYKLCDRRAIEMLIPGAGKLIYQSDRDKIIWIERYNDEKEIKRQEKKNRYKMYIRFRFLVEEFMKNRNMTQHEFSEYVEISRQSLSRYLNGSSIPKVSTMRQICKHMNIDI